MTRAIRINWNTREVSQTLCPLFCFKFTFIFTVDNKRSRLKSFFFIETILMKFIFISLNLKMNNDREATRFDQDPNRQHEILYRWNDIPAHPPLNHPVNKCMQHYDQG